MAEDPDDFPRNRRVQPIDLTPLGIAELEEYIAGLEREIDRARAAIDAKKRHRSGLDGLFKST
jgi:uncharacterized small protein (DUF1192 family)